jgi:hypothetical protein
MINFKKIEGVKLAAERTLKKMWNIEGLWPRPLSYRLEYT